MYWPTKEGEPVEYGKHKVTLQSETVSGDYIIRKIQVVNEKVSICNDWSVNTQYMYMYMYAFNYMQDTLSTTSTCSLPTLSIYICM